MTAGDRDHEAAVATWLGRAAGVSTPEIIEAFEQAFTALWRRVHLTLGEVMLTAVVERVLRSASEQYPALAAIVIAESGLRCDRLRTTEGLDADQICAAFRFVLVEFLSVLGSLTADILTPALHDELSRCHVHAKSSGSKEDEA